MKIPISIKNRSFWASCNEVGTIIHLRPENDITHPFYVDYQKVYAKPVRIMYPKPRIVVCRDSNRDASILPVNAKRAYRKVVVAVQYCDMTHLPYMKENYSSLVCCLDLKSPLVNWSAQWTWYFPWLKRNLPLSTFRIKLNSRPRQKTTSSISDNYWPFYMMLRSKSNWILCQHAVSSLKGRLFAGTRGSLSHTVKEISNWPPLVILRKFVHSSSGKCLLQVWAWLHKKRRSSHQ